MAGWSIPEDFPLGEHVTQELTSISIGRHYVRLLFARSSGTVASALRNRDEAAVEIEAGFKLKTNTGQTVDTENSDLASGSAHLIDLLGQTIVSIERRPNNQLSLGFSNDAALLLIVDERGFESYHLHVAGQSTDVTKEW